jgi:hypothetical protein
VRGGGGSGCRPGGCGGGGRPRWACPGGLRCHVAAALSLGARSPFSTLAILPQGCTATPPSEHASKRQRAESPAVRGGGGGGGASHDDALQGGPFLQEFTYFVYEIVDSSLCCVQFSRNSAD